MNRSVLERSHIRVGACRFMPAVMEEMGLDVDRLLGQNGLSRDLLAQPKNLVPISRIAAAAEEAASEARCPTFGLRVGLCGGLHSLTPIADQLMQAGTLGRALAILCSSFSLYNRGARLEFTINDKMAELHFIILDPSVRSGEQLSMGAMAVAHNAIQQLCPDWRPSVVSLPSAPPRDTRELVASFGSKLNFNSVFASLEFRAGFCARPLAHSEFRRDIMLPKLDMPLAEAVAWACFDRLLRGKDTSSDRVARDLALSRRTLHRRLASERTTFREVLNAARFGAAERLIRDTDMSMTVVALSLGYSELSAFTRAFHHHFGYPPSAARRSLSREAGFAD